MISKSLSTSRKYAALTAEAGELAEFCQVLFPLIVAHADDFGRLPGDVFTIRHLVLPTSTRTLEQFNAALTALDQVGLIQRYRVQGGDYIQVVRFEQHQVGLSRRTKSKFPKPPCNSVKFTETQAQLNRTKQNLTEQNLTEPNGNTDDGIVWMPTGDGWSMPLDEAFAEFQSAYPASRRQGGFLVQQGFVAAVLAVKGGVPELMSRLEQHKRSAQWRTPKLIPSMRTWFEEERWRQELPEFDEAPRSELTDKLDRATKEFLRD